MAHTTTNCWALVAGAFALPNGTEPTFLVDFENGLFKNGETVVAMSDLIEESESYSGWDPSLVEEGVGLTDPEGTTQAVFRLKKALFATLGNGFTVVPVVAGSGSTVVIHAMDDPDFNNDFTLRTTPNNTSSITIGDGSGATSTTTSDDSAVATVAFNASMTRLAGSIDGLAPITFDVTYDASAHPFDTSVVALTGAGITLRSIAWYPLQDEADLPTLSAL